MDLIVTHNNADFDAFSSLVAAKKLYPDSRLLLPGSQEKALRKFLSLVKDKISVESERTCKLGDIKRLIIVDTRHKSRIGVAGELINKKNVEIHIYDHHPRTRFDIKPDKDVFQEVGATVTILLDLIGKRGNIKITPLEATIMLLGIYEETGSLTFRTTTKLDVDMVSFLLSKGANLQAVSLYINRELTAEELSFLIKLINSTEIHNINGVAVAISTGSMENYIGELGTIVYKLHEVENYPVLFALLETGNKLRVMARSKIIEVDVNKILKQFGGGGHKSAASLRIKDMNIETFRVKLIKILKNQIKLNFYARDIMSYPVKVLSPNITIAEAEKVLKKNHVKGMPVVDRNKIIGIITCEDIQKALKHNYTHASVKGYMKRNIVTIDEKTPLHVIQKIMFENNLGRLPVLKNNELVGIVTRTDVLKCVHRDIFKKSSINRPISIQVNIHSRMKKTLPSQILKMLKKIGRCANMEGYNAYVVGGFVRDMLMGVKNYDLDIVVEGDAIDFGRKLANLFKGSLVVHKKFGTSTVVIDWPDYIPKPKGSIINKFKIDLATARREWYKTPAALPEVEFSSLKDDLRRRDFTINAMASSINRKNFGQLIDFFDGKHDLESGIIRVLHDGSFIDDPTRIFRAVRFEQRYGFRIEPHTEYLIKHAIKEEMFSKTENQRIRDELILMLMEDNPINAVLRMKELGELKFIHKKIEVDNSVVKLFRNIKKSLSWYNKSEFKRREIDSHIIYFMALLDNLSLKNIEDICNKFALKGADRVRLKSLKKNYKSVLTKLGATYLKPSKIYKILEPLSFEEIIFIRAKTPDKIIRRRIANFFARYNKVRIKISGKDLKDIGLKPGPLYKKILTEVLYKKIDGAIETKTDELNFAKRYISDKGAQSETRYFKDRTVY